MEAKSLAAIKEQLEKERTALQGRAEKLRTELAGLDGDLSKIQGAINALEGTPAVGPAKKVAKSKQPSNRAGGKKAAGKADVIRFMQAILAEDGILDTEKLKEEVEERLTREGFSRMGFALRFKEALADSQFVDSPGGIRLAEGKALVH